MYNYHLCISSNTSFTNNNWYLRQEEKQISGSSGAVGEEAFIATVSNADCAVAKRLVISFSLKIAYQQHPQDCCYLYHHRHSRYQLDNKHSSLWRYIPLINYLCLSHFLDMLFLWQLLYYLHHAPWIWLKGSKVAFMRYDIISAIMARSLDIQCPLLDLKVYCWQRKE